MIRLNSKSLSPKTSSHLRSKQAKVDGNPTFDLQSDRAKSLWNSKTNTKAGELAFGEIKDSLIEMCVGVEICNYCENNEATDIEHIYPKSHFPERAFIWDNYLLACKTCNTAWKLDHFDVFNPAASTNIHTILRGSGQPPSTDAVFIDPRTEDPMNFIQLDINGRTFRFGIIPTLNERDKKKAQNTLKILGLNDRDALVNSRKAAASFFISRLEKYVQIKEAADFASLEVIVTDLDFIDTSLRFNDEQSRLLLLIKKQILNYSNPTIWKELIRQRSHLNRTKDLLNRAPEAISWI